MMCSATEQADGAGPVVRFRQLNTASAPATEDDIQRRARPARRGFVDASGFVLHYDVAQGTELQRHANLCVEVVDNGATELPEACGKRGDRSADHMDDADRSTGWRRARGS